MDKSMLGHYAEDFKDIAFKNMYFNMELVSICYHVDNLTSLLVGSILYRRSPSLCKYVVVYFSQNRNF